MILDDAERRLRAGEAPTAVATWLINQGLSSQVAYEVVGVFTGAPPDVVPESVFPLQTAARPTGQELFDQMTKSQQDELLGPDVAAAVRSGEVKLEDLVVKQPMKTEDDFIAQATPDDLGLIDE